MTDAVKLPDLKYPDLQDDGSGLSETRRQSRGPRRIRAVGAQTSASAPPETECQLVPDLPTGIAAADLQPGEIDRLYRALQVQILDTREVDLQPALDISILRVTVCRRCVSLLDFA